MKFTELGTTDTVNQDGMIEYRDRYFSAMHKQLRVNPELDAHEWKLAIKSIRLFKKHVNMTKKENAQEIRETRARFRANKPRIHKSRRNGLAAGLFNFGIDVSRSSHAMNLKNALLPLEIRKEMHDDLLLTSDQLLHQIEIWIIENGAV